MLPVGAVLKVAAQAATPRMTAKTTWMVVAVEEPEKMFRLARVNRDGRITPNKKTQSVHVSLLARLIGQGRIDVTGQVLPVAQDAAVA